MKKKSGFFSSKYFSLLIIIVALLVIFTVWSGGQMIKPINIRNILNNLVLLSMIGCGACFLMLYGELDISAGAIGCGSAGGISGSTGIFCSSSRACFKTSSAFPTLRIK